MKRSSKPSVPRRSSKKTGTRSSATTTRQADQKLLLDSYKILTEHFKIGVYRTTPGPKGSFLEVNTALVTMLGFENAAELLRFPVNHFYQNPKDRITFSGKLSQQGVVFNEELTLRRKDGSPLVVSEIAVAVRAPNGRVLYFHGLVEDITERRLTEKQFDLQRTYLEKLFNAAPEAIALHDNNDSIVDINDEFTAVFGYTREEAIGRNINDLVAPKELMNEAIDVSQRVIRGERIEMETKRKRKDGTLIDVSILGAPILHQGRQIGDYAIYRDITERKKAGEVIRIQKTYLESLLNSAPEAIVFHGVNDIIENVNDEFLKMFGYSREEAIGQPINSLVVPSALKAEASALSTIVAQGQRVEQETQRRRKDGTVFDVSILGAPIFDQGKQIGVYAIYRDITERKKTEREILLQKSYFEQLFNSAPEAILMHDANDLIVSVNDEFCRMFGYSREESIGKLVNDIVAPAELIEEAQRFSQMSFRGERVDAETKRKRKDGTLIDVSILGAPVIFEGKQIAVYGIYRDITEHKKEEDRRIRSQEEARMAHNIQLNFLPKSNPAIDGYDIAGKEVTAMTVGGDYYDFIRLDDHRLAIGIGDVSGSGLAASLVMANLQATIRSLSLSNLPPAQCLERANTLLYRSTDARTFVSVFYGIFDQQRHTLSYANAGQNLPLLFSEGAPAKTLSARGLALGLKENSQYEHQVIELRPNDILVLYTDGITEAMNDAMEEFGEERLRAHIEKTKDVSAPAIIDLLFNTVQDFAAHRSQHDDMTAVLLKRIR